MAYDGYNRLTGNGASAALSYDPVGRLSELTQSGTIRRFLYDGADIIAEYDQNNALVARYVHGPGTDEPLVAYDGPNLYAYVGNDPINATDPSGLCQESLGYGDDEWFLTASGCGCPRRVQCFDPPSPFDRQDYQTSPTYDGTGGGGRNGAGPAFSDARSPNTQCSPKPLTDIAGKLWASPNTAIGMNWGALGYFVGKVLGTNPSYKIANNAIQFHNSPLQYQGRPVTLGNVQIYGPGVGPDESTLGYTPGVAMLYGKHEEGHTKQAEVLGPFYLPFAVFGLLEPGADRYGRGESCSAF